MKKEHWTQRTINQSGHNSDLDKSKLTLIYIKNAYDKNM